MRSLRILHVTPYFTDAWAYGGIPRIATSLAHGLAERGHHVTVCATDACSDRARLLNPESRSRFASWTPASAAPNVVLRVFPNLSNRLAYQQLFLPLGLGNYLKHAARDFDVAHIHACRNLPGVIAARHLRRAGIPYVLEPNGTAPRIERRQFAKRVFDTAIGSRVLGSAARFLAVSQAEQRQLRSIGVPQDAIRMVPNPVELAEFPAELPRGRFRQAIGATGPLILFLGRITPRKRLDVLVRAFAQLQQPAAQLVIAGNDAGGAVDARRLAETLGVGGRTTFAGLLSGQARFQALADADVVVYATQDEVFGLVPLEALLCGTPVIVADDCGCAEVARAVGGAIVAPLGDAEALARAITAILDQPAFWRTAAADAAIRVRAAYAPSVVCAQMDDVYRELVQLS